MNFKLTDIIELVVCVGGCLLVGFLGSIFTVPSIPTWYAALQKPAFNPPSWLFGPVWTLLYILMGLAAFLVWKKGLSGPGVKLALAVFVVQLILNMTWSFLFFNYHSPFLAYIDIMLLWLAIIVTIILFYQISRPAAWLLLPYILWVSFATVLNFAVWRLN